MQIYQKYRQEGVEFIGLTGDTAEKVPEMEQFINQFAIPWTNGFGAVRIGQKLGVRGYPTAIVFGRDGKEIWSGHSADDLDKAIQRALTTTPE